MALVFGFLTLFTAGYVATSVVTCKQAWAPGCNCNFCVYAAGGIMTALAQILAGVITPGMATVSSSIMTYYGTIQMPNFLSAVSSEIDITSTNIRQWWEMFWSYAVGPSLQSMTRQLSAIDTWQSLQLANMTDGAEMNRLVRTIHEEEVESWREHAPSPQVCQAATMASGLGRGAGVARAYRTMAPLERLARTGNRRTNPDGTPNPSASGRGSDQAVRFQNYCAKYADTRDNAGSTGCTANGFFTAGTPNRDMDVAGEIFAKDTLPVGPIGAGTSGDVDVFGMTVDASGNITIAPDGVGDNRMVIDDIITNLAEPFAKNPIPPSAVPSATGTQRILETQAYKAKRQAIYDALYFVVGRRVPGTRMGEFVSQIRAEAGIPPDMISDNPSENEVMNVMLSERFRSGTYSIDQIDQPENNQREMVTQAAFQAIQTSHMLDLMDRYSILLAAQASAATMAAKPFNQSAVESKVKKQP
jgi:hypothetical protein